MLRDIFKWPNIRVIRIPEKDMNKEKLFEE